MTTTAEVSGRKGRVGEPKSIKVDLVKELEAYIEKNENFLVTEYAGLTVEQLTTFRKKLYEENGLSYMVIKNTLFKLALKNKGIEGLDDLLKGPVAVLFAGEDVVTAAKIAKDSAKEYTKLVLKGGFADGKAIGEKEVEAYASLPSKQELYAKVLGTMQSPMRGFVTVLSGPLAGFVRILKQLSEKKES